MKNLCLFWRLDLWYKEKFVSLEIVYFGRHATFTQVSLNCRLDTRVDLLKCVTATGSGASQTPLFNDGSLPFTLRMGVWIRGGGPGTRVRHSFNSVNWVTNPSFTVHCHFVPTFRFQPVEKLSLCSLFDVEQCWVFNPIAHHCTHWWSPSVNCFPLGTWHAPLSTTVLSAGMIHFHTFTFNVL